MVKGTWSTHGKQESERKRRGRGGRGRRIKGDEEGRKKRTSRGTHLKTDLLCFHPGHTDRLVQ